MNNNTYTDNNITYTWPDKMPVSSALAGLFTNALWAPIDPLDPHRQKYYNYNPVGKTPEELLKLKSISALDILWCNPEFAEEGAVPRIKSIPAEINTTTDLFNWIRYYDYTFKYIKLDTHCDYRTKYLTFVVTNGGDITWSGSSSDNALSYSTDDGVTWSNESDNISLSVDIGDKVLWRGTTTTPIYEYGIGRFNGDNGVRYDVEGNIMSLLYGDNFKGETSLNNDYAFYQLFCANEYIVNAENLSLPATTLDDCCYGEMFYSCTNLITAPFELPATTLAGGCYEGMFYGCTNLITAPSVLPATTLATGCYQGMFESCTNLMTAPELPATTLVGSCYNDMFNGCENLNSITCLATNISANNCTADWVYNVAAHGTFTKAINMTWPSGDSGIPSDWSVSNYKSKIDCVKYRIFNKNFDQIGYFGNDGTDAKKFNIKSYYDLSIKSLGHINISAFNNYIKFNESELNIIVGGKRFNINMPWGGIFSSDKDSVTISHKTNSPQSLIRDAITLYSGGIKIKHNNETKELFVDIAYYMQPQNIEGQANPVYRLMPPAYNYTYGNQPITPIVISYSVNNSNKTYLYFPYYEYESTGIHIEPIAKKYFVFEYKNESKGYYFDREIISDVDKTQVLVFDNPTKNYGGKEVYEKVIERLGEIPGQVVPVVWHDYSDEFELFDDSDGGWLHGCAYQRLPNEVIVDMYGVSYTDQVRAFIRLTITKNGNTYSSSEYFKNLDATATTTLNGLMSSTDKSKLDNAVTVESQGFSTEQQAQARTNIGAASTAVATTDSNGLMSSTDKSNLDNAVTVQSQEFNKDQRMKACANIHAVSYDPGQVLQDSQRANARTHIHAVSYDKDQNLEDTDKQNARANIHAVSYDKNQNLGDTDKQNARNNIGAASSSSDLIGEIKMWCSSIIPDGYLLCDGRTFDTTAYPKLYALLGTHVLPDLRDRFIVGAGSSYSVGTFGGEKEHTLTTDEMPSHSHQFDNIIFSENHGNIDTTKGHAGGVYGYLTNGSLVKGRVGNIPGGSPNDGLPGTNNEVDYDNDTFPYMTMPTASTGGSKPHNNMPPYYALTFIIRASGGIIPDIPDYSQDYFTMTVTTGGTINFTGTGSNVLYYSKNNGTTWIEASGNIPVSANDKILWKGDTTPIEDIEENGIGTFGGDINVRYSVEGNAMSLLFGNNEEFKRKTSLEGNDYAFYDLFFGNKNITSADNLSLPATTLVDSCYVRMFYGCTNLTTAPKLPAGTLAYYCYGNMFSGCTSLMTAPKLPATTLISGCYKSMFYNCTSLTTAPELPATTLAFECYSYMFQGCENLTTVPFVLPATVLADSCYQNMFYNCTSLTIAPKLPATVLANNCYKGMFGGCRILTTAPELPATTLAQNCYDSMFRGCENLTTAPELPATTLTQECYYNMFKGCTSLNSIKCLATDISVTSGYTIDWVSNVASSGTFIKDASANWGSGTSAIPIGWNVINYSNNSSNSLDAEFEEEQTEEQSPDSEPEVNP